MVWKKWLLASSRLDTHNQAPYDEGKVAHQAYGYPTGEGVPTRCLVYTDSKHTFEFSLKWTITITHYYNFSQVWLMFKDSKDF